MAVLDFPNSPTVGQQYAAPNGATYQWDGSAWVVTGGPPAVPTGPASGDLTGAYPSPVVAKASNRFAVPTDNSSGTIPQITIGSATQKGGIEIDNTGGFALHVNHPWYPQDLTKPSWLLQLETITPATHLFGRKANAAAGVASELLKVDTLGALTLPGDSASQFMATFGTGTVKSRLHASNASGDWMALSTNTNTYTGARDDTSKVAWEMLLRNDMDQFQVRRRDTSGVLTTPLTIENGGSYIYLGNVSPRPMIQAYAGAMAMHANFAWGPDNPAMSSWTAYCRPDTDQFVLYRRAPNAAAGAVAAPLVVDGPSGKTTCSLANNTVTQPMLALAATLYSIGSVALPASWQTSGPGSWQAVGGGLTVWSRGSGALIQLTCTGSFKYVGAAGTNTFYLGWFRDGGLIGQTAWDFGAGAAGFWTIPVPMVCPVESGLPAGSHTYQIGWYVANSNGNIIARGDSNGYLYATCLA